MRKFFHEDFLLLAFLEILIVKNFYFGRLFVDFFFFEMFSLRLFCCEDLFNCSSLRLKNCFNLLVLRLKIFVLVI
jgi:hypothetical protein